MRQEKITLYLSYRSVSQIGTGRSEKLVTARPGWSPAFGIVLKQLILHVKSNFLPCYIFVVQYFIIIISLMP